MHDVIIQLPISIAIEIGFTSQKSKFSEFSIEVKNAEQHVCTSAPYIILLTPNIICLPVLGQRRS